MIICRFGLIMKKISVILFWLLLFYNACSSTEPELINRSMTITANDQARMARISIEMIYNASELYLIETENFPLDIEQLVSAGMIDDLPFSVKSTWTFQLQLPEQIVAISMKGMNGGAGKVISFDALEQKFSGYLVSKNGLY